jgi:hypothetical protein
MASTQSGFDDSVQANAMRSQNPMCRGSDLTCQSPEGTAGQQVLYLNPEAQFLSLVRFPQIWVPRWKNRDLRQLLQHRHRIVEARTRITSLLDEASQALPEAWVTPSKITTCVSHLSPNVRCQIGLPNHSGIFDNEDRALCASRTQGLKLAIPRIGSVLFIELLLKDVWRSEFG